MSNGFIKLNRGPDTDDLLLDPQAFALLCQVAMRARRTGGYNVHALEVGEALIGDHRQLGMTRRQYRTRLDRLAKAGFLTIKTTNKGTIARLVNSKVFDINSDENGQQNGHRAASKRPTDGQRAATNKNEKKGKNEKRECVFSSVKEAVSFFQAEFPEVPVRLSLTKLVEQKGKEALTESYCRDWLIGERRRKKPHPSARQYIHEEPPLDAELAGPTPTEDEVRAMSNKTIRPFLEKMGKRIRNGAEEAV